MNHEELDDLVSSAKADIQAIRGVNSTIKSAISFFISVALFLLYLEWALLFTGT